MIDDFGYESPINIYYGEIQQQIENEIMKSVTGVGVHVDKEELLAALRYDRGQYEKGYQDGLNANKWIPVEERLPEEKGTYLCYEVCGNYPCYGVLNFAKNLHKVDKYDFENKKRPGFYYFDSEYGYIEDTNVFAWMPLPAPYDMRKKVEE